MCSFLLCGSSCYIPIYFSGSKLCDQFLQVERMLKKLEEMVALMSRYITPVTDLLSNVLLPNMLSFVSYLAEWFFAVVFPGPGFGKAAVALHSVGPVLSFMAGCTSNDAFFLAFVPGVIAGVGLSIAFEQRQEQRSLARRRKVSRDLADHYQILISCSPFLNSSLAVHFLTGGFLLKCFSVISSIPICHLLYRMSSLCFLG